MSGTANATYNSSIAVAVTGSLNHDVLDKALQVARNQNIFWQLSV